MWGRRRKEIREPADVTGPRSDFAMDYALSTRLGVEVAWSYDHGPDLTVTNPLSGRLATVTYANSGRRKHDPDRAIEALAAVAGKMETGLSYGDAVDRVATERGRPGPA